jgi:VWFA-related protein
MEPLPRPRHRVVGPSAVPVLVALALLGAALPGVLTLRAAQENERALFVSVVDEDGLPVANMRTTDFVIEEDGVQREILRVGPARTPMQVAVLVDTSGSAQSAISDLRDGIQRLISGLGQDHEVALVAFGQRPQILTESTRSLDRLQDGIGKIFAFPNTAAYLLDALVETATGFERRTSPRPVIVVIATEGIDYSNRNARQALDALTEARVSTHVLVLRGSASRALRSDPGLADALRERDMVLAQGPDRTGGLRRDLMTSNAVPGALDRLAAVLTSQYEVTYSRPARLIPPDEITVRMRRDDLTASGTPVGQTGE